ncbi:MAG TPA: phage tail protein [Pseudonocardiaceae bacterium]|jgi:phage tail-like protein|nr:phage tail protein [Pseudonocardiaceae bacterium]
MSLGAELSKGIGTLTGAVSMNHRFVVVIDRSTYDLGSWSGASGLSVSWSTCEYRSGDQGNDVWIFPGTTKYQNIKLQRAACSDSAIVQSWLCATSRTPQPLSGTVQLIDWLGFSVVEWRLTEFFPVGWSITEFDASTGRPVIETLELAHTGFLADALK